MSSSFWKAYIKYEKGVFQISHDILIYLFVYIGVYVSPQICPLYFKVALLSFM